MSAGGTGPACYECCQIYAKANCSDERDEDATNTMIHTYELRNAKRSIARSGSLQRRSPAWKRGLRNHPGGGRCSRFVWSPRPWLPRAGRVKISGSV